jgi:hypothetical protein
MKAEQAREDVILKVASLKENDCVGADKTVDPTCRASSD